MSEPSPSTSETPAFLRIGVTSTRQARKQPAANSMATHKFAIGKTVRFRQRGGDRGTSSTSYRIVAHRPVAGGEPWYLVQSDLERHARVVAETDLQ